MPISNDTHFHLSSSISRQFFTAGALASLLLLGACAQKTEAEQLAEMRDTLVYTQYRNLSENGLPLALQAYKVGAQLAKEPDLPTLTAENICTLRVITSYGALATDKRRIALAEADLVQAKKCPLLEQAAASSLQAVIFHRENWPLLAKERSDETQRLLQGKGQDKQGRDRLLIFHLSLAAAFAHEKRFDQALLHFESLAIMLEQPWLTFSAKSALALDQGNLAESVRLLKRSSEDPSMPPELRASTQTFIEQLERQTGNVDAPALMERVILIGMWQAVKEHGPRNLAEMARFADQQLSTAIDISAPDVESWWSRLKAEWAKNGAKEDAKK